MKLCRTYTRTVKKFVFLQRWENIALKAQRHLKTIAGAACKRIKQKIECKTIKKASRFIKII